MAVEPFRINTGKPRVLGDWANGAPQGDTIKQSELAYHQAFSFRSANETNRLRSATRKALGRV